MGGSPHPMSLCDHACAWINHCSVGGIQCLRCDNWFCSDEINEDGYCAECAKEKAAEEMEEEDA